MNDFISLMELREKLGSRIELLLREQESPNVDFSSLPENIRMYVSNSCRFWIYQAQVDMLSEIMTGNVASDYVPELYDIARKRNREESVTLKKIRMVVDRPTINDNKNKLNEIKKLLE
jgi:hypothetical protein